MSNTIKLTNIQGTARYSGTDEHGNAWIQDDGSGLEEPDECGECGREMWGGWVCLDGGDVACDDCVEWEMEK